MALTSWCDVNGVWKNVLKSTPVLKISMHDSIIGGELVEVF